MGTSNKMPKKPQGLRHQFFQHNPQLPADPWRIWDQEADAELVVGEMDGVEIMAVFDGTVPWDVCQPALQLGQINVDVAFLDQDEVATLRANLFEQFCDAWKGGVPMGELAEVGAGFESDHGFS
jgi:hypothetical protein